MVAKLVHLIKIYQFEIYTHGFFPVLRDVSLNMWVLTTSCVALSWENNECQIRRKKCYYNQTVSQNDYLLGMRRLLHV